MFYKYVLAVLILSSIGCSPTPQSNSHRVEYQNLRKLDSVEAYSKYIKNNPKSDWVHIFAHCER